MKNCYVACGKREDDSEFFTNTLATRKIGTQNIDFTVDTWYENSSVYLKIYYLKNNINDDIIYV
jgi:hypothetical protein